MNMTNFLHFSPTEYTYGQYITFIRKNFQSCRLSTIILRIVQLHTFLRVAVKITRYKKGNARCAGGYNIRKITSCIHVRIIEILIRLQETIL